jgi:hypothetical protein
MTPQKIGWDNLFLTGSVLDLDVSMWSGRTKIKAADLGIEDSDAVHQVLALGNHRLIPREAFEKINEAVRAAKRSVEYYSLSFPFVRGARYVPENRMVPLREKLEAHRANFVDAVEAFVAKYDDEKQKTLPTIEKALKDAARNEMAAVMALDRLKLEYPLPVEVRNKFALRWNIYAIRAPKTGAAADAAAQETETVKGIVKGMVEQLRVEFMEKVGAVISAVARGGKLPGPTIDSAREVIARLEETNVFADEVLAAQLSRFKSVVDKAESDGAYMVRGAAVDLDAIKTAIDKSADDAVADAERALTGLGRRKVAAKKEAAE